MKKQLRQEYAAMRDSFPSENRATCDQKIREIFLRAYGGFNSYFIYNSFKSEADTKGIIAALSKTGKRVYLPRVEGGKMLCVPLGKTYTGAFGIEEPEGEPYLGDIDIVVTPLLAVDGRGYRLGYGGGYYDRFFAARDALKVGLGYGFQITDKNFAESWDKPLNAFICERGITIYD